MNESISEMDKQLQGTPRVNLVIAIEKNRAKRNVCLFLCVIVAATFLFLSWSRWFLLLPAALGIGAALYQLNILIVSSELKRRSVES